MAADQIPSLPGATDPDELDELVLLDYTAHT
jgi:hypothetical protein